MEKATEALQTRSELIERNWETVKELMETLIKSKHQTLLNELLETIHESQSIRAQKIAEINVLQCNLLKKLCQMMIDVDFLTNHNKSEDKSEQTQNVIKLNEADITNDSKEFDEVKMEPTEEDSGSATYPESFSAEMIPTIMEKMKETNSWKRAEEVDTEVEQPVTSDISFQPSGKLMSDLSKSEESNHVVHRNLCYRDKSVPSVYEECMLSHMESPSEFYIHLIDEETHHIDDIGEILRSFYENFQFTAATKEEAKRKVHCCCVAYVPSYETWYRTEVVDWQLENGDEVTIHLVDFGQKYNIPFHNLRPVSKQFTIMPKLAIRCHLAGLEPPNKSPSWPTESIETFLEIVNPISSIQYYLPYVKQESSSRSLSVELAQSVDGVSIGQMLLDKKMADITDVYKKLFKAHKSYERGIADIPSMTQEEKVAKYLMQSSDLERAENINMAVGNCDPTDEARICKFGANCRKRSCRFTHEPITKDFTKDKSCSYLRAFNELVLPATDEEIKILITEVCDVCNFYAQLLPNRDGECHFNDLLTMINNPLNVRKHKPLRMSPAISQIVLAQDTFGDWCRAQVRDVKSNENETDIEIEVLLVDSGETEQVKMANLAEIPADYLHVPFQAVKCRLHSIVPGNKVCANAAKKYFEDKYEGEELTARVVSSQECLELLVYKDDGEEIGQHLIEQDMALPRTAQLFPSENEILLVD